MQGHSIGRPCVVRWAGLLVMTQLLQLFLLVAPWVAILGGLVILALAALHVSGWRALPGIESGRVLPGVAALLLGISLLGLGVTYLLTGGAVGYNAVYLLWLGVAAASGLLGMAGSR